jgi:hypothetical protein
MYKAKSEVVVEAVEAVRSGEVVVESNLER